MSVDPLPHWQLSTTGPETAPVAVLLHGFLGRADDWAETSRSLKGFGRVLAFDLPGHGRAEARPPEEFSLDGAANAVLRALDEASVDRFNLVGYSLGGRIALHIAKHAPARLLGLGLVGAHPGLLDPGERDDRLVHDRDVAREMIRDFPSFLQVWLEQPVFAGMSPAIRNQIYTQRLRDSAAGSGRVASMSRLLEGTSTGLQENMVPVLAALGSPVHLVAGRKDPRYVDILSRLKAAIPVVDLTIVEGAGHNVPAEQPAKLAAVINRLASAG